MRTLLIGLLVVAGLAVAVDRGAEAYAESAIADRIDAQLDQRPEVEIEGWSFLLQAVQGEYEQITVTGERASRSGVVVSDFRAELLDVTVPLSEVIQGSVAQVPTRLIRGSALLRFEDINDLAEIAGSGLTLQAAGAGRVRVSGTIEIAGARVQASAVSDVRLDGNSIVVRSSGFEVNGAPAPAAVRAAIGDLFDVRFALPTLPYDLRIERLTVTDEGIRLAASARGVVLTR